MSLSRLFLYLLGVVLLVLGVSSWVQVSSAVGVSDSSSHLNHNTADPEAAINALQTEYQQAYFTRTETDYINQDKTFKFSRYYEFVAEQQYQPTAMGNWQLEWSFSSLKKLKSVQVSPSPESIEDSSSLDTDEILSSTQSEQNSEYAFLEAGEYQVINSLYIFKKTEQGWVSYFDNGHTLQLQGQQWVLSVSNPDNQRLERYVYNAQGDLLSVETPSHDYQLSYNSQQMLTAIHRSDNISIQLTYNAQGHINQLIDPQGYTTHYEYDEQQRLVRVIKPDNTPQDNYDNPVIQYHYNDRSHPRLLTQITAPNGHVCLKCRYDSATQTIIYKDLFKPAEPESEGTVEETYSNGLVLLYDYASYFGFSTSAKPQLIHGFAPNGEVILANDGYSQFLDGSSTDLYMTKLVTRFVAPCQSCTTDKNIKQQEEHFDAEGRLLYRLYINLNDHITRYDYINEQGQDFSEWVSKTEAVGTLEERTTQRVFDSQHRRVIQLTQGARVIDYAYDAQGNKLSETHTDSHTGEQRITRYTYNAQGLLLQSDGPRTDVNDITRYSYDSSGNLVKVTNALDHEQTYEYDASGNQTAIVEANDYRSFKQYGANQKVVFAVQHSGLNPGTQTRYEYNAMGDIQREYLPTGGYRDYHYNASRQLIRKQDNLGQQTHYTRDPKGNLLLETDYCHQGKLIQQKERRYDEKGRLIYSGAGCEGCGESGGYQYSYDPMGNTLSETDGNGNSVRYRYDALNRKIARIDSAGETTYQYNELDQLTKVIDPRGVVTEYSYNAFGDKLSETSQSIGEIHYAYDAASNLITTTRADGSSEARQYDALSRVTQIDMTASNSEKSRIKQRFIYDQGANSLGRISQQIDTHSNTRYEYDEQGNTIAVHIEQDGHVQSTRYAYDHNNQLIQLTYPSGLIVNYQQDEYGNVRQIEARQADRSQIIAQDIYYQPSATDILTLTYGNGLTQRRDYNQQGQLVEQWLGAANHQEQPLEQIKYQHNSQGNVQAVNNKNSGLSHRFEYDEQQQLVLTEQPEQSELYQYDMAGNRISETRQLNKKHQKQSAKNKQKSHMQRQTDYHYAQGSNQLTRKNRQVLRYNKTGQLIEQGKWQYGYDAAQRLTHLYKRNQLIAEYRYHVGGQRLKKQHYKKNGNSKVTTYFTYNEKGHLLSEQSQKMRREFIWLHDKPLAQIETRYNKKGRIKNQKIIYIHSDHLDTPRLATDEKQQVVWSWDSSAFGKREARQGAGTDGKRVAINLRFAGQYYDEESGLHYNHHRYYDPESGRYIQSDPIGLLGGLNRYAYVNNNPVNHVDPRGLQPSSGFVTATLVGTVEVTTVPPPPAFPTPTRTNRPPSGGPCAEPEEEHQGNVITITANPKRYDCYYSYTDGYGRGQPHIERNRWSCSATVPVRVDCPPEHYFSYGRCKKNVTPPPEPDISIPESPSSTKNFKDKEGKINLKKMKKELGLCDIPLQLPLSQSKKDAINRSYRDFDNRLQFKTIEEAVAAAGLVAAANPKKDRIDRFSSLQLIEHGGGIYRNSNGTYTFSFYEGYVDSTGSMAFQGKNFVADWHTHPDIGSGGDLGFSREDRDSTKQLTRAHKNYEGGYLINPKGQIKKYVWSESQKEWVIDGEKEKIKNVRASCD